MIHKNIIKVWNLGRVSYAHGLQLQSILALRHHRQTTPSDCNDALLIMEHLPVYTIGIRSKGYTSRDINQLRQTGADFAKTNRGGLITFHGPGQLVVYPIINLKHYRCSMKWYIHNLENCIVDLCNKHYHLKAYTSPYTGVWIKDRKVCAIGIHGSRFITTHGLALNCNTDLSWFNHIVPCGIKDKGVTSLSVEVKKMVTIEDTIPKFLQTFCLRFNCTLLDLSEEERMTILNCLDGG